jgi:hypothetical protein
LAHTFQETLETLQIFNEKGLPLYVLIILFHSASFYRFAKRIRRKGALLKFTWGRGEGV